MMKSWHAWVLAVSILIGCGAITFAHVEINRYQHLSIQVDGRLCRVDRFSGAVETYRAGSGWHNVIYP
jgi:hypothetical protein